MNFLRMLLVLSLLVSGFLSPAAGISALGGCHTEKNAPDDCCGDNTDGTNCSGISCATCATPLALAQPFNAAFITLPMPVVVQQALLVLRDAHYPDFRPPDFLS